MTNDFIERYADLITGPAGLNLQPGQAVTVATRTPDSKLAAAVDAACRRHSAAAVGFDSTRPELPNGVIGLLATSGGSAHWTTAPDPNPAWAQELWPELDADDAYARLCDAIAQACRLDDEAPTAAWLARQRELADRAQRLNERQLRAVRFQGPRADLQVGLLPHSLWLGGRLSAGASDFGPNLPSEEIHAVPDPAAVAGWVETTRPLQLPGGVIVPMFRVEFTPGREADVRVPGEADGLVAELARPGMRRLGEVALVACDNPTWRLGIAFNNVLLDENAASHLAFGRPIPDALAADDAERANTGAVGHIDFVIGAPDVDATGLTADGEEVPLLRAGEWAF
jgi:aminopeptidase